MPEQPETNTTSKKNPSPTGQEAAQTTPRIEAEAILRLVHSAAKSARLRIVDGRAREAMAIFEHELHYRIEAFTKERS